MILWMYTTQMAVNPIVLHQIKHIIMLGERIDVLGTELDARTLCWLVIDLLGPATLRASVISGKAAPVRA